MARKIILPVTLLSQLFGPTLVLGGSSYSLKPTKRCADECLSTGENPARWSTFPLTGYFESCVWSPALFTYDINSATHNYNRTTMINACVDFGEDLPTVIPSLKSNGRIAATQINAETSFIVSNDPQRVIPDQAVFSGLLIQSSLLRNEKSNISYGNGIATYAHYGNTVVGIWIGDNFDQGEFATTVLDDFIGSVNHHGIGQTLQTQLCLRNGTGAASYGIIADTSFGIKAFSTDKPKSWTVTAKNGYVRSTEQLLVPNNTQSNLVQSNSWVPAVCDIIEVQPGDFCYTLADKCKMTLEEFKQVNQKLNLCDNMQPGQKLCCSQGDFPDMRPKREPDGSCASYYVIRDDSCSKIAAKNDLTVNDLERFNKDTWGWNGCDRLQAKFTMCLSEGSPPFPAANPNAVCGPTKPGTAPSRSLSRSWAKLNPCPLKACCNIWGQCGTTEDFCIDQSTGNPGTSKGRNGCISNCGTTIVNNNKPPAEFRKIGYFEAWNKNRKCLRMDYTEVPPNEYTHIHFAFPDITTGYQVDVSRVKDQFDKFVGTTGSSYKKIASLGGWAFSTEVETHGIFRNGVRAGAREAFAANIADFVLKNNLDGIDIDWEYPGVPDMNWLPRSSPDEGPNYLEFLKLLRAKLPPNKSLSIAAPASFWYLKAFPIENISKVVDYIVYMTYDLHGQWDYGNKWTTAGCEKGDCLRSHVDLVETYNALSMLTKAGVPSYKIVVGVSSYGRQFKMTDPNCAGKNCTYVGPKSNATPGRCTGTLEYISNAEIKEIIQRDPRAKVISNGDNSKTLIYDGNWVSWMDDQDKIARANLYKSLKFGGTVDWAIDLVKFWKADLLDIIIHDIGNAYSGGCGWISWGGMRGGGIWHGCEKSKGSNPAECGTDESWRSIGCGNPGISKYNDASETLWNNVKAPAAWCSGIKDWISKRDNELQGYSFPQQLSQYYNGPPDFYCDVLTTDLASGGCMTPSSCKGPDDQSAAAMQHILHSLHNIHESFRRMYNGLKEAERGKDDGLRLFVKTFTPREDKSLSIFYSIFSTVVSIGTAGYFNSFLKQSKFGSENKVFTDNAKDITRDVVSMANGFGKDAFKDLSAKKDLDIKEQVMAAFGTTVRAWIYITEKVTAEIFSGNDRSLRLLSEMLKDGNSLKRKPLPVSAVRQPAEKLLYSTLILATWRMQGFWPVLVDTNKACSDMGVGTKDWTNPKDLLHLARICIGDRQYHMLAVSGSYGCSSWAATGPGTPGTQHCNFKLQVPPGLKDIRKDTTIPEWGKLNIYTMIDSAAYSHGILGGNHRFSEDDIVNDEFLDIALNSMPDGSDLSTLPGVIDIPFCGWEEIKENWKNKSSRDKNYPCNG